jgi:hypothetical protein
MAIRRKAIAPQAPRGGLSGRIRRYIVIAIDAGPGHLK